jgi:drug/metabolite transporter (DMT)-like permease
MGSALPDKDAAWKRHRAGLAFLLTAVVAWSTAALFTRMLSVDTPTILFWRGVFGAGGLLALLAIPRFGGWGAFRHLGRGGWAYAVVCAFSMVFFISALTHTSVAHVAVITATVPLIAALLGWLILGEKPGASAIAASLAALTGVAIMVGFGTEGHWSGDMLAIIMALTMGVMIILSRKFVFPALHASCMASGLSALMVMPFATITGLAAGDLMTLLVFSLFTQIGGFGLFAIGSAMVPAIETALITTLEAPLAPFWVWLFLNEAPGGAALAGGAIVLAAVLAHFLWQMRKAS